MSANTSRVKVSVDLWTHDAAKWQAWCPWCGECVAEHRYTFGMAMEDALDHYCAGVRLTALLARLETLRDQWRQRAEDRLREAAKSDDPDAHDGFVSGISVAAAELDRLIREAAA